MVKHIVIWRLKEEAEGASKQENATNLKVRIEALKDLIPDIITIEVGINNQVSDQAGDIVLYSEFADWDALERYQQHHEHQAVVALVRTLTSERRVVDYVAEG